MKRAAAALSFAGASLALAAGAFFPSLAAAQTTNTARIVTDTLAAAPSCLRWRPSGMCFWLRCRFPSCSFRTSIRVSHYNPDLVVSTYHEGTQHPWTDWGRALNAVASPMGSTLLRMPIDSAGTRTSESQVGHGAKFRDGDAIGNPLGGLRGLLSGEMPDIVNPASVVFASADGQGTTVALPQFAPPPDPQAPSQPQPSPAQPGDSGGTLAPTGPCGGGDLCGTPAPAPTPTPPVRQPTPLPSFLSSLISGSGITMFCSTPAVAFMPHLHSKIDALSWRGMLPVESLFPSSIVPGMREVGNFPSNTWGSVYPRVGWLVQQHPVKASAVISQRIGDIVTRDGEPHVYFPLQSGGIASLGGQRVWLPGPLVEGDASTGVWQRLTPSADSSCRTFGENDTLSLTSWGDGRTTTAEGYAYNLWRPYSCCDQAGNIFLGAVTW